MNVIELDLLLAGRRMPTRQPLPAADFYYLLSRGADRPNCQVYSWWLRDGLPTLPIPLRSPDPDIHVDLARVFATAYDRARFRRCINYRAALTTALSTEDRAWAEAVSQSVGV